MPPVDIEQFRLEDYKLKLANLSAHSDRMWRRFNYFVTIEAGLVVLFAIAGLNKLGLTAAAVGLAHGLDDLLASSDREDKRRRSPFRGWEPDAIDVVVPAG